MLSQMPIHNLHINMFSTYFRASLAPRQGSVKVSVIYPVMIPDAYCQYLSNQTLHPPHNVRERTPPLIMVSRHIITELCSSLYCKHVWLPLKYSGEFPRTMIQSWRNINSISWCHFFPLVLCKPLTLFSFLEVLQSHSNIKANKQF